MVVEFGGSTLCHGASTSAILWPRCGQARIGPDNSALPCMRIARAGGCRYSAGEREVSVSWSVGKPRPAGRMVATGTTIRALQLVGKVPSYTLTVAGLVVTVLAEWRLRRDQWRLPKEGGHSPMRLGGRKDSAGESALARKASSSYASFVLGGGGGFAAVVRRPEYPTVLRTSAKTAALTCSGKGGNDHLDFLAETKTLSTKIRTFSIDRFRDGVTIGDRRMWVGAGW